MATKRRRKDATRRLVTIALMACVCSLWAGCVAHANHLLPEWTVRRPSEAARQDATENHTLRPGMSKEEVETLAADLLDKRWADTWVLKRQFTPFQPGIYPYFDSRRIILYFDAAGKLSAIVEQGEYNVYP